MGKNRVRNSGLSNHRQFTLRCLSEKVTPVSIKLKSHIKTPKGLQIIRRADRSLLNERVRTINNTINMMNMKKDTCINNLKQKIGEDLIKECEIFIKERREARHFKTMVRQKSKLEALCHKSISERGGCSNIIHIGRGDHSHENNNNNIQSGTQNIINRTQRRDTEKWVINISDKALSDDEEKLLAQGPNFAIVPKNPPIVQYVAAIEQACTKLEEGKADEFRVQVKVAIQKVQKTKPNVTREERIALTNLKKRPFQDGIDSR